MRALNRKLLRDLGHMKGQAAAIAVVIGAGVMVLILSVTTLDAISLSKDRFYEAGNFAEVFSDLKRAPEGVAGRLREIPGVNLVETRVVAPVRLEVEDFPDPVRGLLLSIPDGRQPDLNRLYIREGGLPESGRSDQVAVSEPFAKAHGLRAGDRLRAIINGRLETLTISGLVLSPEFIYQLGPADLIPDYERYALLWMNRRALANAFAMDGAFNSAVMTLQAGANEAAVIDAVDMILAPYGGIGAHGRDDQISHRFLEQELDQLRVMALILPAIFLGVAAFLLNVLMARIVNTQRQQVAVLKAFGYGNRAIALHFASMAGAIACFGALLGIVFGAWAGEGLAVVYAEYFRFPELSIRYQPRILVLGFAIAIGAALLGTFRAVLGAARQPPAEAMRPPTPEAFRQGWLEHSAFGRMLDQPSLMVLRNLTRHRYKATMSVIGIGLSASLLLVGGYQFNAIDRLLDIQYRLVLKMDLHLAFTEPTPERALAELRVQPGVHHVEAYRSVPVRLVHGARNYRTAILGLDAEPQLQNLIDSRYRPIRLPPEGLLMTGYLADHLGLRPGDFVRVEVMEGHRRTLSAQLAGVVDEPIGVSAYMERRALNRLMREGPAVSGAWLLTDRSREDELFARLWEVPRIASIGLISEVERSFRGYIEDTALIMMGIMLGLAGSIAFAVVYNNARIAFAERARELATLRVLGFTRAEVAWILIGEIMLLSFVAIPIGWVAGTGFAWLLNDAISIDLFRIPFVITTQTYALAAGGVLLASVLSVLLVYRRLHRLDMVTALKTVE
jgi:putative ABC transport system permease protein